MIKAITIRTDRPHSLLEGKHDKNRSKQAGVAIVACALEKAIDAVLGRMSPDGFHTPQAAHANIDHGLLVVLA